MFLKQIIQTGIPAFLMQILIVFLNIILNASLLNMVRLALSAIGIVTSIQTLPYFDATTSLMQRSTTIDFI